MFLLVSGRHVGAHPDGHQFREKASPHILHKKNCCDLNHGDSFVADYLGRYKPEVNRAGVSTYGTTVPELSIALCTI